MTTETVFNEPKHLTIATGRFLLFWGWWELRQTGYPTERGYCSTWLRGFLKAYRILEARDPCAAEAVRKAFIDHAKEMGL